MPRTFRYLSASLVLVIALVSPTALLAATLVWDTGSFTGSGSSLMGADNVSVLGADYDVRFVDGSCHSIFGTEECGLPSSFAFSNFDEARAATAALIGQVFNASLGSEYLFIDNFPQLTNGCDNLSSCLIYTPYSRIASEVRASVLFNSLFATSDNGIAGLHFILDDLSNIGVATYAVWSEVSPVPVPPAVFLFGSALMALRLLRRRNLQ